MSSFWRQDTCGHPPQKLFKNSQNSVSPVESFVEQAGIKSTGTNVSDSSQKQSRWKILKNKRNRVGVVSVDKNHIHYKILSCIREGLRRVVADNPALSAKGVLTTEDFNEVTRINGSSDRQEFEFESYAGSVFATLRQSVGIDEQEFINTVALSDQPYLEFKSNSKSGQVFFLSHNKEFMFKSNRKRDVVFFLSILPKYLQHFISYPHSLLVKYVGCYTVKLKGKRRKYFLAMQSIFYPADRITDRFDIKGCTAGRYQEPVDPNSHMFTVLKDQNFLNEELDFGDQGDWFVKQVAVDSQFLSDLNCMDYSMLIGRQKRHADERTSNTIYTVINRAGKSISPTRKKRTSLPIDKYNISYHADEDDNFIDNKNNAETNSQSPTTTSVAQLDNTRTSVDQISRETIVLPSVKPGIMFPRSLADGVDKFLAEQRRLLPKCPNELHVIDGTEYRYFLGIVDFLTLFDWHQKTAQFWKMVKYSCGDHSTKRPDVYQTRFVSFLCERVK